MFKRCFGFGYSAIFTYAQLGKPDEEVGVVREWEAAGYRLGYELRSMLTFSDFKYLTADPRYRELMDQDEAQARAQPDPIDL
jgi:hypothetical protein